MFSKRPVLMMALLTILLLAVLPAAGAQEMPAGEKKASSEATPDEAPDGAPQGPEAKLAAMGIELSTPAPPSANFVRAVRTGNLVFLAGHGPVKPEGGFVQGRLGKDLSIEDGYEAARLTAIALLASLKAEIGDLDRVTRIVKVHGMVNAEPSFTDHSKVMNGCSDFLVEIFGEEVGKHARAAVGMSSLPLGFAVEIEMVVEVR